MVLVITLFMRLYYPFLLIAGDDYGAVGSRVITFPTGVTSQTFVIGIVDDALPENEEYFNADLFLLNNTDNVAIGQPQQPLIEITDDDCK